MWLLMMNSSRASPTPAFGIACNSKASCGLPTFIVSLTGSCGKATPSIASTWTCRPAPHPRGPAAEASRSETDLLPDRPAADQDSRSLLEAVAQLRLRTGARLDGLRPCLQHVQAPIQPVLTPLDVHWSAVVALDP